MKCKITYLFFAAFFSSCQNGEKIVNSINYNGEECIETFYAKIDIVNGDTVKTPCGKHTIKDINGNVLSEWEDKYVSPNKSHKIGVYKEYENNYSNKNGDVFYVAVKKIYSNDGSLKSEQFYNYIKEDTYLYKEVKYSNGNEDWSDITKTYYESGCIESEIIRYFGSPMRNTIDAKYYTEDGKELSALELFYNSLNDDIVYNTFIFEGDEIVNYSLAFFPDNYTEGRVTLLPFKENFDAIYRNGITAYYYRIENNNMLIYSGHKVYGSSPIRDIILEMRISDNHAVEFIGNFKDDIRLFKKENINCDISNWKYK